KEVRDTFQDVQAGQGLLVQTPELPEDGQAVAAVFAEAGIGTAIIQAIRRQGTDGAHEFLIGQQVVVAEAALERAVNEEDFHPWRFKPVYSRTPARNGPFPPCRAPTPCRR